MFEIIILTLFILLLIGALPVWPHSRRWSRFPSGGLGLLIMIMVVLVLVGRI